jgi:hypothetical protein
MTGEKVPVVPPSDTAVAPGAPSIEDNADVLPFVFPVAEKPRRTIEPQGQPDHQGALFELLAKPRKADAKKPGCSG